MTTFAIAPIESGAERYEGTFSEVWYGRMRAPSSQSAFPVYFKMLPAREFWVETACLSFSEAAGLPVGECYWGKVSRSDLPDSNQWQPGEEQRVTIAVRAVRGTSLHKAQSAELVKSLRKDSSFIRMCVVDELFANGDRHNSNVMISTRSTPVFIDFGHAFGGPKNPFSNPFPLFDNQLLLAAIAGMDLRQLQSFRVDLSDAINEIKSAMPILNEALSRCPMRADMVEFVRSRMAVLRELLAQRLEVGQQQSLRLPTRPEILQ